MVSVVSLVSTRVWGGSFRPELAVTFHSSQSPGTGMGGGVGEGDAASPGCGDMGPSLALASTVVES